MKLLTVLLVLGLPLAAQSDTVKRLDAATETLSEIMGAPDKGIPQDLLDKAECAVVVPGVLKGGFIIAGKYGRGFAVCRNADGKGWGAPSGVRIEGGSFGFQIGGSQTDVVMLMMNRKGMERLTSSKFTVGGDASVAAGPVGRESTAQTDATMRAEILSWSRSRGVFAGIALNGATLRPDQAANDELYGGGKQPKDILLGAVPPPAASQKLVSLLNKYSSRHTG
jgi:lipid-binding SYLF domain-containing protein